MGCSDSTMETCKTKSEKGKEIIYHYLSCGWVGGDGGGLLWLMM